MSAPDSRKRPHPDGQDAQVNGAAAPKSEFHEKLVREVLCRWWYCMPDWPPALDWKAELKTRKYREVQVHEWEASEEEVDGFKKVYPIGNYPGLFRNVKGEIVDCRPKESCPSYNNFLKKDIPELLTLLSRAYANQIASLVASGCPAGKDDEKLRDALIKRHEQANATMQKKGGTPTLKVPAVPEYPCVGAPAKQGAKGTPAKSPESKTPTAKGSPPATASPKKAPSPAPSSVKTPATDTPVKSEPAPGTLPVESQP
jgi:hypothetical protein